MSAQTPDYANLMRQALLKLEQAHARIRTLEASVHEPIAVIGMACRFPGAPNLDAFHRLLESGTDAISAAPRGRWDGYSPLRPAGYLDSIDEFDPRFFGISAEEASAMDPQQRILLEVSWHALEDSGLAGRSLTERRMGVFTGVCGSEYRDRIVRGPLEDVNAYCGAGVAASVLAGRVAYFLGLTGPAIALDTACSSSLVAIHLAMRSLRAGECGAALAGGVNVLASPYATEAFTKAGMLAPNGRSKAFDDSADGYARGEGCGIVVLKRLSDALADQDRIHAVISGSAINADGRTSGLTVPSSTAQQEVIRLALDDARLTPDQVQYVEAHGTGTSLGDPIELGALAAVYGAGRQQPVRLGAVKSNIGHLESAAGAAGLIKTILSLRHRRLYPNLHVNKPTTRFDWNDSHLRLATAEPWPAAEGQPLRAGVSSFGFSGTNAHLIVTEPPPHRAEPAPESNTLLITARDPEALKDLAAAYAAIIPDDPAQLATLCTAAQRNRRKFPHRFAAQGTPAQIRKALTTFEPNIDPADVELTDGPAIHYNLPLYPFRRERYWMPVRTTAAPPPATDLYEMKWRPWRPGVNTTIPRLTAANEPYIRRAAAASDAEIYSRLIPALEARAAHYAAEALRRLDPKSVLPRYQPLLARLHQLVPAALPLPEGDFAELRLLDRCGPALDLVLRGLADPIELLFPNGDFSDLTAIYRDSAGARLMNQILERYAVTAAAAVEGTPRILEAGAGTGGATARLLPALARFQPEYWFTDVSEAFLEQARQNFAAYSFLRFRTLDLDSASAPAERFDIIIAANVLHATRDLARTLTHLRARLNPGGLLIAQESLTPMAWVDLTFGLTEGWWRFTDRHLRPSHPLIGRAQWLDLLATCGYEQPAVTDLAGQPASIFGQAALLARNPSMPRTTAAHHIHGRDLFTTLDAVRTHAAKPGRLVISTSHAIAVSPGDTTENHEQAPLWGLGKVAQLEYPALETRLVDAESPAALDAELTCSGPEQLTAWRNGVRYVARLERRAEPVSRTFPLNPDGCYIVAGGTGGLGQLLVRWLTEKGARQILVLGRSAPKPTDITDPTSLSRAIAEATLPIRGVIHAAGVLEDSVIDRLTPAALDRVLAPKVTGLVNLHDATIASPLDFFVIFSSAVGLLGNPGQASHAAASSYGASFAHHRRSLGLPALCIDWGAWADTGAAARRRDQGSLQMPGVRGITPARGLQVMEALMAEGATHAAVLDIDWSQFPIAAPHLEAVLPRAAAPPAEPATAEDPQSYLTAQIAAMLGFAPAAIDAAAGLNEIGVDSLMAVRLRNRVKTDLGVDIPVVTLMENQSIRQLATLLEQQTVVEGVL